VGMPQAANDWTVERVLALPDDGNRYEVVDGELLVSPSPEFHHQDAVLALATILRPHVRANDIGIVCIAPADIELDDRTLVQPDIFVFEPPEGRAPEHWRDVRSILLAIEVLSPSTARYDRQLKRRRYQRQGIPEYWIVDLDARLVERWRPGDERPEILNQTIEWVPDGGKPVLTIDLEGLFREMFGG
jgi:Uma2 family endonuclease